jgi:archaemetzincin
MSVRRILLTPISTDEPLLDALRPFLETAFEASLDVSGTLRLPADAYDLARRQYRSAVLLGLLARQKPTVYERQLGITDVDLYTPDLHFVFGEADAQRGIAVFSLARLHTPDPDRFVHRAATEAIHELAHTCGLTHCSDRRCVMWFSNTLAETDRKGTGFCPAHTEMLRRALNRHSS